MEYNTLGKYIAAALWLTNLPAPVGVEGLVTKQGTRQMLQKRNSIHPIDTYAGIKLREARKLRGMSQAALGQELPDKVTFQQIQKYERGTNRISISRMYELARVLQLPLDYFVPYDAETQLPLITKQETALLDHFRRLAPMTQDKIVALICAVTEA